MWVCSRVGRGNSLSVLRQIRIYGSRYKIEKIQKLTENFEKACWRSVRVAEERAYLQKYHFLKHCLNLINQHTSRGRFVPQPSQLDRNTNPLSQSIIDKYDLENSKQCLEEAEALLARTTSTPSEKESEVEGSSGNVSEPREQNKEQDRERLDKGDVKRLKNIILKLKQNVNLVENQGNDPDLVGYTKSELEKMLKL